MRIPPPRASAFSLGADLFGRHAGPADLSTERRRHLAEAWDEKPRGRPCHDRFQTIHKSENDLAFTLSPEQKDRLITDEQVRYQAFSMLSGNEWARITFEYKGLYRDVLESDIPKLKLLEESTSDGIDQVRYEIETFSLLGFQKYIQRFDGDFVFLKIETIDH